MKMNRSLYLLVCFAYITVSLSKAQLNYRAELNAIAGTGSENAFWLQNNRFGQFSESTNSGNMLLSVCKPIHPSANVFDWGAGFEVATNISSNGFEFIPIEYYAEGKWWIFDAVVGAKKQHYGVQDAALSSGGLIFSDNVRPIPAIEVGIFNYITVPYTFNALEIKGLIRHGWFTDNVYGKNVLLHHKSASVRIGGASAINLSYGFEHVAQWGGVVPGIGEQPVTLSNFYRIFMGRSGSTDATLSDQINVLGSHIISQNINLEFNLGNWTAALYWQNISEDKPILLPWNAMNKRDGLWGGWMRNPQFPVIKGITLEYICTLDKSGPWHDKDGIVFGGADSYFNNVYDWAYYSRTIGNPFLLSPLYNAPVSKDVLYNSVRGFHFGMDGAAGRYNYKVLTSMMNYYPQLKSDYQPHVFWMVELNRYIHPENNMELGLALAGDKGSIVGDNLNVMLSFRIKGWVR